MELACRFYEARLGGVAWVMSFRFYEASLGCVSGIITLRPYGAEVTADFIQLTDTRSAWCSGQETDTRLQRSQMS